MTGEGEDQKQPALETMRIYDLLDLLRIARAAGDDELSKRINTVLDERGYFRRRASFGMRGAAC